MYTNLLKTKDIAKNKGFTLVEMMVGVIIFTISILAMIVILSNGIADTSFAKNKLIASYLAQEGIEQVRNLRDSYSLYGGSTGWGDFVSAINLCDVALGGGDPSEAGCVIVTDDLVNSVLDEMQFVVKGCFNGDCEEMFFDQSSGVYGYEDGDLSGFTRKIFIRTNLISSSEEEVFVFSIVSWEQAGRTNEVVFSTVLRNWIRAI